MLLAEVVGCFFAFPNSAVVVGDDVDAFDAFNGLILCRRRRRFFVLFSRSRAVSWKDRHDPLEIWPLRL